MYSDWAHSGERFGELRARCTRVHRLCYHAGPFLEFRLRALGSLTLIVPQPYMLWDSSLWFSREVLLSAPFREEQCSECGPHARSTGCRLPGSFSPPWSPSVGSVQGAGTVTSSPAGLRLGEA